MGPLTRVVNLRLRGIFEQVQHCNNEVDSGRLIWVLPTPDLHRSRHSSDPAEDNSDFGAVTNLLDCIFRARYEPARDFDANVGVGDIPDFPAAFPGQMSVPWRWRTLEAAAS
jgi:hypothetical protein